MKTLLLARHGKSDWGDSSVGDFDRPLNTRGEEDSPKMASYLQQCGYLINQIISSEAVRALATAEQYRKHLTPDQELITHGDLYLAPEATIINIINNIHSNFNSVMLVGHNPGMTDAINFLCHEQIEDMSTCSVGIVQFDVNNWRDIKERSGDLLAYEFPKKLKKREAWVKVKALHQLQKIKL